MIEHGIDLGRVLAFWPAVGPDFVARMAEPVPALESSVVPFGRGGAAPAADGTLRSAAAARLWREDAAVHAARFARLAEAGRAEGCVTFACRSAFVANYVAANLGERLLSALRAEDASVRTVGVVVG